MNKFEKIRLLFSISLLLLAQSYFESENILSLDLLRQVNQLDTKDCLFIIHRVSMLR